MGGFRFHGQRLLLGLILMVVFFCLQLFYTVPAMAQQEEEPGTQQQPATPAEQAEQYVKQFKRREEAKARKKVLDNEILWLESAGGTKDFFQKLGSLDQDGRDALTEVLRSDAGELEKNLSSSLDEAKNHLENVRESWVTVRTNLHQQQDHPEVAEEDSPWRFDLRWFWLCGLIAVAGMGAAIVHDRRHELRRMFKGSSKPRSFGLSKILGVLMILMVLITGGMFFFSDLISPFFFSDRISPPPAIQDIDPDSSPLEDQAQQIATIETEAKDLENKLAESGEDFRKALESRKQALAELDAPDDVLLKTSESTREHLRNLAVNTLVLQQLSGAFQNDLDSLKSVNARLKGQKVQEAESTRIEVWVGIGLGAFYLMLMSVSGHVFWRDYKKRCKTTSNTCPLCMATDTLELVSAVPSENGKGENDISKNDPPIGQMAHCTSMMNYETHEPCDFMFTASYREMTKLCFPTLGIPSAGKTHWLASLYRELIRGNYPYTVQFEKVRSQSSDDFDVLIDDIINTKIGTAATQRDRIPHPLLFNFRDHDRLFGSSNVLVNIFDYSGEVLSDMPVDDFRRRRALEGDGFFFFLDPTVPSEQQTKAMDDFREDLRQINGLKAGQKIHIPIAMCVPKIDLFIHQRYASPEGGDAIDHFFQELAKIDPDGETINHKTIRARSNLIASLCETIWPGWQVERQVEELFGRRHMFFPLSPIGLDNMREIDPLEKTIAPFGLLEPLMWLLEINGYPVLM